MDISQCRVIAAFSRPDGSTSLQDSGMQDGGVTIGGGSGNEIDISLFPSSFSPGMVECELQIYSDAALSTLVATARFNFSCRKAIINEDTLQASPEYPLLRSLTDELKNSADGLSELMEQVQSAETSRELAEAQRQQAAARFVNLSAEVNILSSGAEPTASVTDTETGKHISPGIPSGPKGMPEIRATQALRVKRARTAQRALPLPPPSGRTAPFHGATTAGCKIPLR